MENKDKIQLTKEGLEELKKELKKRKTSVRKELRDQLDEDLQEGDITENTNYYRVQDEIASNDKRIGELEEMINNAEIVEETVCKPGQCKVTIGSKVTIGRDGRKLTYTVAGETQADPTKKIISIKSPLGQALEGKKVGDVITVKTPTGSQKYDIIEIL